MNHIFVYNYVATYFCYCPEHDHQLKFDWNFLLYFAYLLYLRPHTLAQCGLGKMYLYFKLIALHANEQLNALYVLRALSKLPAQNKLIAI